MFDINIFLDSDIRKIIESNFPAIDIVNYYDDQQDCYFVSISDETVYYSEAFQQVVMDIKINVLWKHNINNYYFIFEEKSCSDDIWINASFVDHQQQVFTPWSVSDSTHFSDVESEVSIDYAMVA